MQARVVVAAVVLGGVVGMLGAVGAGTVTTAPATRPAATVETACPGLATAALTHARLADLPDGVLVKSGAVTLTKAELEKEIADADEFVKPQLEKQAFFLAERMATGRLLAAEAKTAALTTRPAAQSDDSLISALLDPVVKKATVTEAEVKTFYEANTEAVGGAPLADVKAQIEAYLLGEKRDQAVSAYVRNLGQRMDIQVAAAWAKAQVALARDNPLDQARWSGKLPTVANASKDSQAAAAAMLNKLRKHR